MPSSVQKPDRRQEILQAFERLVARFGLDRVSMKDLAREAGVSVGSIYLEFENKEALILSVEEKWRTHVAQRNAAIEAGNLSPQAKLHGIIVEHVTAFSRIVREDQAVFELLSGALHLRYLGRAAADTRREIFDLMTESAATVLREGCRSGAFEVEDAARTARLMVEAFAEYFSAPEVVKRPHEEVAERAEGMFDLLMKAIRAK
jgi:AcrR family transcriptional regulator